MKTDKEFRTKLNAAVEAYTGERSEEAIFHNVLVPLVAEYGVTAAYDEFKDFINSLNDGEMSRDELKQAAGEKETIMIPNKRIIIHVIQYGVYSGL